MIRPRTWVVGGLVALILAATLGAGSALAAPPQDAPAPEIKGEYAEGYLIVGFEESTNSEDKSKAHRAVGSTDAKKLGQSRADLVKLPQDKSIEAAIDEYRGQAGVAYAEPDYILRSDGIPNDPMFTSQWGLRNTGQVFEGTPSTVDADIDAAESTAGTDAWSLTMGSPDVVVAVIDSGIDFGHPDLGANKWVNRGEIPGNGIDDDRNLLIDDINGWDFAHGDASVFDVGETCPELTTAHNDDHGTHVAGIIAAGGNNGLGITGVAPNVKLMSLKFLEITSNFCGGGRTSRAVMAIDYAIAKGANVINASWGGTEGTVPLRDAIQRAGAAGIVVTSAAGNDNQNIGTTPDYPASYDLPNQIVVAASNRFDNKAAVSNYGGATDVAAPGELILSTIVTNNNGTVRTSPYKYYTGTSMATPMVAGSIALLKAYYPLASSAELISRIYSTVDVKAAFGSGVTSTGGRINVNNALRLNKVVVTTAEPVTVTEGGATESYSMRLGRAPTSNVTITVNDGSELTTTPSSLVFTPSNWSTARSLSIAAVDDSKAEGAHSAVIHHAAASTDPYYNGAGIGGVAVSITDNDGVPPPPPPPSKPEGYWLVASDGGIFTFGNLSFYGSTGAMTLNKPIVGMAAHPSGNGYWLVASDGGIFTFGAAQFYGSTGAMKLNKPIVGMAAHPSGNGYWLVASDGGIFTFGAAQFHGSTGAMTLNQPIVGMAAHPSGNGYWLVASDGGIFTFGVAKFHGSTGAMRLNKPIVGMAAHSTGNGYWLVASDGGIFTFGVASFYGSTGAMTLNKPIVGMAAHPNGNGYWLVASDGGIFTFGAAKFYGSTGAMTLNKPIVGMAAAA